MLKASRTVALRKDPEPEPVEEIIEEEPMTELPPAIPTTREELAVRARQRYEERLALLDNADLDSLELKSARQKAKNTYLRELDDSMK